VGLVDGFGGSRPLREEPDLSRATERDRVTGGGQLDFGALYDEHVDTVWRLLVRLGVHPSVLEDAAQDVFVVAHRQLATFRGESTMRTWLTGITLRVAKDYRRAASRRGDAEPLEVADDVHAPGRPDEQAMANQSLRHVLRIADQLEDAQRLVFTLVEFEGFTVPEVAALTGTNANTLSTRLRAARARFNELVELHVEEVR